MSILINIEISRGYILLGCIILKFQNERCYLRVKGIMNINNLLGNINRLMGKNIFNLLGKNICRHLGKNICSLLGKNICRIQGYINSLLDKSIRRMGNMSRMSRGIYKTRVIIKWIKNNLSILTKDLCYMKYKIYIFFYYKDKKSHRLLRKL